MVIAVGEMFIWSKIVAKSFGDGSQDIFKDTEIWDQLLVCKAEIIQK